MDLIDVYKLLHQAAMGPGHAVTDATGARERLLAEIAALDNGPEDPLFDRISPDGKLVRIHLRSYLREGHSVDALLDAFLQTANSYPASREKLERFCGCLGDLAEAGGIAFKRVEVESYFSAIAEQNYPVVRHSESYRDEYLPAYRVVALEHLPEVGGQ
ncbi:MAG: hypothetical protein ABI612_22070, partial [Betaproteobacteria bacterium]